LNRQVRPGLREKRTATRRFAAPAGIKHHAAAAPEAGQIGRLSFGLRSKNGGEENDGENYARRDETGKP
jgi:hypothetical protein